MTTASASLLKANKLTQEYEDKLSESRKDAQKIIKITKQEAEHIVAKNIEEAQKKAEKLLADAYQELNIQKSLALKNLANQVDILSDQIFAKLLNN